MCIKCAQIEMLIMMISSSYELSGRLTSSMWLIPAAVNVLHERGDGQFEETVRNVVPQTNLEKTWKCRFRS